MIITRRRIKLGLFLAATVLISFIIYQPGKITVWLGIPPRLRGRIVRHPWDWMFHASVYGALTFFAGRFLIELSKTWSKIRRIWTLGAVIVGMGIIDELTQSSRILARIGLQGLYRASRTASPADVLADATGIFIAVFILKRIISSSEPVSNDAPGRLDHPPPADGPDDVERNDTDVSSNAS